jgi:hypothetical protein
MLVLLLWPLIVAAIWVLVESLIWGIVVTAIPFVFLISVGRSSKQGETEIEDEAASKETGNFGGEKKLSLILSQLSLLIYSLVGTFPIIVLRRIRQFGTFDPYSDWHVPDLPPDLYSSVKLGLGYFNKLHIRNGLLEICIISLCLYLALIAVQWFARSRGWKFGSIDLHPATALHLVVVLFGSVLFPPYAIDNTHWNTMIGIAVDASQGIWPYFHAVAHYGFLIGPVLLVFISILELSRLALAGLVITLTAAAGVAAYTLISKISGSKWIGLLGVTILLFGFYDLGLAIRFSNAGAQRFQFMIAVSLLLTWIVLNRQDMRGVLAAGALGLFLLWHPSQQAFLILPLFFCLLYQRLTSDNHLVFKKLMAIGLGVLIPVVLILLFFSKPWQLTDIEGLIYRATYASNLYIGGYGGIRQVIALSDLVWLLTGLLGIVLLVLKVLYRGKLSNEELFLICSLVYAFPTVLYHLSRTSWISAHALAWVMFPVFVLVCKLVWGSNHKDYFYRAVAVISLAFIIDLGILTNIKARVERVLLPYEIEREAWINECIDELYAGQPCENMTWPDMRSEIWRAHQAMIDLNDSTNLALIDACQQDIPVYSLIEAILFWYGDCRIPFTESLRVYDRSEAFKQEALGFNKVYIDLRHHDWESFAVFTVNRTRELFLKEGYCEVQSPDLAYSVLSRGCGSESQ